MHDVMNEKKDVEVKAQSKTETSALWGDLTPDRTRLGVLSSVAVLDDQTVHKKTAVALRIEGDDGKVTLVTLTGANFQEVAKKVRQAMSRFNEPWDF